MRESSGSTAPPASAAPQRTEQLPRCKRLCAVVARRQFRCIAHLLCRRTFAAAGTIRWCEHYYRGASAGWSASSPASRRVRENAPLISRRTEKSVHRAFKVYTGNIICTRRRCLAPWLLSVHRNEHKFIGDMWTSWSLPTSKSQINIGSASLLQSN